ncbi:MAG: hypothetical protein ABIP75_04500, partial [Pyrinomonadaceae bacterium]
MKRLGKPNCARTEGAPLRPRQLSSRVFNAQPIYGIDQTFHIWLFSYGVYYLAKWHTAHYNHRMVEGGMSMGIRNVKRQELQRLEAKTL